jgi:hypothetical protein
VYEIAERLIEGQFSAPVRPPESTEAISITSPLWNGFRRIEDALLGDTETRHETLLKHSGLTAPVVQFWNSAVFEHFHQISPQTPLYSLDPPVLFFREEVNSFQTEHSQEEVIKLADNITLLSETLSAQYGCTLVFVPVPNKITVYSRMATDRPYDEFSPRLCSVLKQRGVRTVDLLPRFREQTGMLYWPSDSHWNNAGIRIAVEESLKELR